MKRFVAIILTVVITMSVAACGNAPEATQPQNDSFQIGNLHFSLDSGMIVEEVGENTYIVTLKEKRAFVTIYAGDVSEMGVDMAELFVDVQHKSLTEDRDALLYETDYSMDIAGFPADGEVCSTLTDSGIVWGHMDHSFTDTWYSYTFMFSFVVGYEKELDSDTEYSTSKEYGALYGDFLNKVNYKGPAPRESGTEGIETPVDFTDYPGNTGIEISGAEETLPDIIFTTTGEENGLADTLYIIEGKVIKTGTNNNYPYFIVSTDGGDVWISEISEETVRQNAGDSELEFDMELLKSYYPLPDEGEHIRVYAQYQGMSRKTNYPSFVYGSIDYLTTALSLSTASFSDPPAQTPPPETRPTTTKPTVTAAPETTPPTTQASQPAGPTNSESNALKKAKEYLRIMPFSHDGLIDQLEYEGFSRSDATYGADNCGADWNEQATKKAKLYLDTKAFSYSGLIDQLEYEKYTKAQATYGADNCGANWNEQAAKAAVNYLEIMSFSRERLIDQLEYEGFTHEQAVYGVDSVGL